MNQKDNLRNKLRPEGKLPEEFSWDSMEEGIFSKLEELEESDPPRQYGFAVRWLYLLLFVVSGVGGCYVIQNQLMTPEEDVEIQFATKKETIIPNQESSLEKNENDAPVRSPIHQNTIIASTPYVSSEAQLSSEGINDDLHTSNISPYADIAKTAGNDMIMANENEQNTYTIENQQNDLSRSISFLPLNEKDADNSGKNINDGGLSSGYAFIAIPHLPIESFSYDDILINSDEMSLAEIELSSNDFRPFWSLSGGGGTNLLAHSYGVGSFASDVSTDFESEVPGFSIVSNIERNWHPNFSISGGLHWSRYYRKFAYEGITTERVALNDEIIALSTNALTGTTSEVRGAAQATVTKTRNVIHYNSFDHIALPVLIHFNKKERMMDLSIGTGIALSYINASGKTVRNEQIIEFASSQNPIFSSGLGVLGRVQARIGLALTHQLSIRIESSYNRSFSNFSNEALEQFRPKALDGVITLGYRY